MTCSPIPIHVSYSKHSFDFAPVCCPLTFQYVSPHLSVLVVPKSPCINQFFLTAYGTWALAAAAAAASHRRCWKKSCIVCRGHPSRHLSPAAGRQQQRVTVVLVRTCIMCSVQCDTMVSLTLRVSISRGTAFSDN